jgi:uncharacterized tellurite resistance protein B-like protein
MAPAPAHLALSRAASGSETASHARALEPEQPQTIEGEAHTVEIEVAQLEALIAAAETRDAETAQTDATAQARRSLRIAFGDPRRAEAGR